MTTPERATHAQHNKATNDDLYLLYHWFGSSSFTFVEVNLPETFWQPFSAKTMEST